MDCLFCKIAHKEQQASIIYEDDAVVSFLDIHPCSKGHTVVIPLQHAETLLEVPAEQLGDLWKGVQHTLALLKETLHPDGFTIGINHGKVSGQAVEHLHIHLIPRWKDDGGGSLHSVVSAPPEETVEETYKKMTNV